ncbi:MAG: AlpA family phage regulatory protein [Hyphomicrobiaceae bacterium]|nr:AlpA family phage regulatory protein [Hyphomicrobiaceae bacterium]
MQNRRQNSTSKLQDQTDAKSEINDLARREIPPPQPIDNELWSIKIICHKTGLSRASVYKYIELGLFPRQRHLGPGRVAWRSSEVKNWIETRR